MASMLAHTTAAATLASQQAAGNKITAPTASTGKTEPSDKMKDSAKDFEAVFLSEMLGHMFEGTEPDKMFGGGQGEKMFQSMMVQQYGKMMANGQGIGIAAQMQKYMLQVQEQPAAQATAPAASAISSYQ